jgi:hypothetical protein
MRSLWLTNEFRVSLSASDHTAHTSQNIDQGATAHQPHGCVLWAASSRTSYPHLKNAAEQTRSIFVKTMNAQ